MRDMIPFFMPQFQQQQERKPIERTPPRVEAAMLLLWRFQMKTAPIVQPHGMGCETLSGEPGQRLTCEEEQTQAVALALLTQYFNGTLPRCEWDDPNAGSYGKARMPCPQCASMGAGVQPGCPMCRGSGMVQISPG
jgi:hypothetical protein